MVFCHTCYIYERMGGGGRGGGGEGGAVFKGSRGHCIILLS